MRKSFRRRAWEEHRTRHGWAEEELVPPHAFRAFLLSMVAVLFFEGYGRDPAAWFSALFLPLSALAAVCSFLFFLLDLDAPRQKPFQKREARRTDGT